MQEIKFNDLIKIFGAAQATTAIKRYVRKEFIDLHKETPRTEEIQHRIAGMKNDPDNVVMALQLDDSGWNIATPSRIHVDVDGNPLDTGPLKATTGEYEVDCELGSFKVNNGDYIFLTADNWKDIKELNAMSQMEFKKTYSQSENTELWM